MSRFLVVALLSFLTSSAHADSFQKLVGYLCDSKKDAIILRYVGAYNEAGKALLANKGPQQWDPWSLIASMKDDDHIGTLRTVEGRCRLKDGVYRITIGPSPGNFNIQGRCGAHISAWAEVRRAAKVVLPQYEFEADCHDTESPITTEIILRAESKKPEVKQVQWNEFYQ